MEGQSVAEHQSRCAPTGRLGKLLQRITGNQSSWTRPGFPPEFQQLPMGPAPAVARAAPDCGSV